MDDFVEWLVINHTQDGMALSNHHPDIIHSVQKFDMDPRIAALSTIQGVTLLPLRNYLRSLVVCPQYYVHAPRKNL